MKTPFSSQHVLVTGAAGFIGSHLIKRLVQQGASVSALVSKGDDCWRIMEVIDSITLLRCDIRDIKSLREIVRQSKPEKAVHLAAKMDLRDFDSLEEGIDTNIKGTLNLARCLTEQDCDTLILLGSCEEYGSNTSPLKEDIRPEPLSFYSCSKTASILYSNVVTKGTGLSTVIMRPFIVYGPAQGNRMFIPQLIISALKRKDFDMTYGDQTRDFVFVDDVVDALVAAVVKPELSGEVINIGTGRPHKIKDVAGMVVDLMGNPIKLNMGALPYREQEMMEVYADCQKAKELLGWVPRTNLLEGLKLTIDWYQENQARYVD